MLKDPRVLDHVRSEDSCDLKACFKLHREFLSTFGACSGAPGQSGLVAFCAHHLFRSIDLCAQGALFKLHRVSLFKFIDYFVNLGFDFQILNFLT